MNSFLYCDGRPYPLACATHPEELCRDGECGRARAVWFDGVGARPYYVSERIEGVGLRTFRHFNEREAAMDYQRRTA